MKYKGHFRIDQNNVTVSKNISKSTLILHNNSKELKIPENIKTKNLLTEEQQRKRGMFCVDEFPKKRFDQLFWNSHFHKLPVWEL